MNTNNLYPNSYYPKIYWTTAKWIITFKDKCEQEWVKNIKDNYRLDIACDLTFKQRKEVVVDGHLEIHKLNDAFALQNLRHFLHRLNQRVFKNAYRRYGKRLDVITSIEGGRDVLRQGVAKDKLLHAHLSLQQPNHLSTEDFVKIVNELWVKSPWGFSQTKVENIRRPTGRAFYQIKNTLDAIVPDLTTHEKDKRNTA